ncbi:DNA polymerase IV [Botrimarina colliarenosi]|uniref:DNA polymerase IV n=2 Tax=Botrimarina colliarenosi TaxID=2528001 RepID=A0A5C6AJ12_9BACT|nr:DNA polymerase IV [Botrimarina colliarenosi]
MPQVDWLFLDMNAFFASAEQQMRPELRGRPVAVVPMMTDTTCCIAASYEARAYGIKTGTNVGQARRQCPGLVLVKGRHEDYVRLHHEILAAIETVLPIEKVCSIDEVACRLSPPDREVDRARQVGERAKLAIKEQVGAQLRCSVGLATNRLLAKLASNLKKPDGLSVITREELPRRLYALELREFTGIGANMQRRLAERGVRTTRQLCGLSCDALVEVWGSRVGALWWHWLRGEEADERATHRRTVGHSHVLAPELRTDEGARGVLVRLLHKAAARLRKLGYVARRIEFGVRYVGDRGGGARGGKWRARVNLARCSDTPTMLKALDTAWRLRSADDLAATPLKVSLSLWKLEPAGGMVLPLFAEERQATQAARTMDAVNAAFGAGSMYFASMHETRDSAPMRIAFSHIPELEPERDPTP